MKKTFILAFFMMFCSMVFGQDWGPVVDPGSSQSITIISSVTLDGDKVEGTNYVLGAFCGNELRGKGTFQNLVSTDNYFAMLLVHGNDGEEISFKL